MAKESSDRRLRPDSRKGGKLDADRNPVFLPRATLHGSIHLFVLRKIHVTRRRKTDDRSRENIRSFRSF
ncbi:hypothetical protein CKA32_001277 [Geitlerinema sp. FC II]|nr:hypothetical protein CKA32_001277 [Geitlerinema sp. FC II]